MLVNIFDNVPVYGDWAAKGADTPLAQMCTPEFYAAIDNAVVTENSYGKSLCIYLNHGQSRIYKPLSTKSKLQAGDTIAKEDIYVTTLSKFGESDIYRMVEKQA